MVTEFCFSGYHILRFNPQLVVLFSSVFALFLLCGIARVLFASVRQCLLVEGISSLQISVFLFFCLAMALCALDLDSAALRLVSPDESEALLAARSLVEGGTYSIDVNGVLAPPRYLPWFSLGVLSPVMALSGGDLDFGNFLAVGFFFVLLVEVGILAMLIGRGIASGFLGVAFVLALPWIRFGAGHAVSHVPAAALVLDAVLWTVLVRRRALRLSALNIGWGLALPIVAFSLRPLAVGAVIPVAAAILSQLSGRQRSVCWVAIALALLSVPIATLLYHFFTFGSIFSSGYYFWLPHIHGDFSNVFALRFFTLNARVFFLNSGAGALALIVLTLTALRLRRSFKLDSAALRTVAFFLLAVGLPALLVHLVYFYQSELFFLPANVLLAILAAAFLGNFLQSYMSAAWSRGTIVATLAGLSAIAFVRDPLMGGIPEELLTAIEGETPEGSWIVSDHDPVHLRGLLHGTRFVRPFSLQAEYASKVDFAARCNPPYRDLQSALVPYSHDPGQQEQARYFLDLNGVGEQVFRKEVETQHLERLSEPLARIVAAPP